MAVHIQSENQKRPTHFRFVPIKVYDQLDEMKVTSDFIDYYTHLFNETIRLERMLIAEKDKTFRLESELKRSWLSRLLFGRLK